MTGREKTLDCLCIKSIDYKDNDKLVTLYAFGEGKITASLRGVKKSTAKLKYASALFCFGKYYLTGKNGYYNVIGCDQVDSFYDLWIDIDKYYHAICSLEILDKVSDDREIGDKLAIITLEFLNELCYKSQNYILSLAKYLSSCIKILGYNLCANCLNCGDSDFDNFYYSHLRGGLVCGDCKDNNCTKISASSAKLISLFEGDISVSDKEFLEKDVYKVVCVMFDFLGKNLAKNFKTFEEYILFYNKIYI